jgi:hypothetical protein
MVDQHKKIDIEYKEKLPVLNTLWCKTVAKAIELFLRFGSWIAVGIFWIYYDYFIGIVAGLVGFLIIGIIRAELRNGVLPPTQREYPFSDKEIAHHFLSKRVCYTH